MRSNFLIVMRMRKRFMGNALARGTHRLSERLHRRIETGVRHLGAEDQPRALYWRPTGQIVIAKRIEDDKPGLLEQGGQGFTVHSTYAFCELVSGSIFFEFDGLDETGHALTQITKGTGDHIVYTSPAQCFGWDEPCAGIFNIEKIQNQKPTCFQVLPNSVQHCQVVAAFVEIPEAGEKVEHAIEPLAQVKV